MASRKHFTTVDEYIQSSPKQVQQILASLREILKGELPQAEEVISYNIPCFKQNGSYVVYFAGYKTHISLYPFSSEMGKAIKETASYKTSGKGTIQFPLNEPLPIPLIKKIVKYMVQENKKRAEKKKTA